MPPSMQVFSIHTESLREWWLLTGKFIRSPREIPGFVVQGKNAFLSEIKSNIWILHGNRRIAADDINREGKPGETVVYTPVFGPTNRADKLHTSYIVENNRVARKFRGIRSAKFLRTEW